MYGTQTAGYGILTNDETKSLDVSNTTDSGLASYGSINHDYTDSYHRWYTEGYDNGLSISSTDYQKHYRNSLYEGYNDSIDGDDLATQSCRTDDGAIIVNSGHENLLTDPSAGETTGGEQTYYTPFYKRQTGIASTPLVAWNILNLLLSTSLLAFPFAVTKGGLIVIPFIILISLIMNYTSRILISMMYEPSPMLRGKKVRVRIDFVDLGQDVFNSYLGGRFIHAIQIVSMFGICVLNLCVLGSLCHEILPKVSIQVCTVMVALLALPTFFIRKLAVIGWLQTIGVFSLALGLIIVEGYCVANISKWKITDVPAYNMRKLPIAIGIVIYAFGIQDVMPGLEEQMKKPMRFGYMLNITFFIAVLVQITFSLTNGFFYGKHIKQVITVDLKDHLPLGISAGCFIGISILSHFSLPTFVVLEKLDTTVLNLCPQCSGNLNSNAGKFASAIMRIGIMCISTCVAVFVPYFAYLMAFIGSGVTVMLSLLIPCCFHLKLRHTSLTCWQIALDVFIVVFGLACFVFGTFFSIHEIIYNYKLEI